MKANCFTWPRSGSRGWTKQLVRSYQGNWLSSLATSTTAGFSSFQEKGFALCFVCASVTILRNFGWISKRGPLWSIWISVHVLKIEEAPKCGTTDPQNLKSTLKGLMKQEVIAERALNHTSEIPPCFLNQSSKCCQATRPFFCGADFV